jgi:tRNA 2-thiouridine synthesizing protein A
MKETKANSEIDIVAHYDFRGLVCPFNFVKTKLALEKIEAGEVIEVIIDSGAPIENLPRSVKEEGHQIIKVERLNEAFRLLIRKGN